MHLLYKGLLVPHFCRCASLNYSLWKIHWTERVRNIIKIVFDCFVKVKQAKYCQLKALKFHLPRYFQNIPPLIKMLLDFVMICCFLSFWISDFTFFRSKAKEILVGFLLFLSLSVILCISHLNYLFCFLFLFDLSAKIHFLPKSRNFIIILA